MSRRCRWPASETLNNNGNRRKSPMPGWCFIFDTAHQAIFLRMVLFGMKAPDEKA
jgi:hypothetical protein